MGAQAVRLTNVDIDNALKNNHFEVIFQPIFQLSDGALLRMEAFVRWVHPGLGVLPPGAFISFFENQGRMSELTRYVISAALKDYKGWRGCRGPGFSVNLAHSDLLDDSFPDWLTATLEEADFPAGSVTLECPSLPATVPADEAAGYFHRLKETGCRLAIEVRGRANEMLQTISPFPFDEVKTGGSAILRFARTVRGGPGLTAISDLLELAKSNDARTVAVGVEDHASLQALASLGFIAAQGNYLAGVGDIRSFAMASVNQVRNSLSLPELEQAELVQLVDGEDPLPLSQTEMVSAAPEPAEAETTEAPEADTEAATETEAAAEEADTDEAEQQAEHERRKAEKLKAAKAAALKKKKAAQLAAKKRAHKIAAEKKAAAEKAQAELEEKQRALKEAEAARAAEDNARKLQDRLSQAFEDDPALSKAADPEPADDPAPEAGLLLGGSLAETALAAEQPGSDTGRPSEEAPVAVEATTGPQEATADLTTETRPDTMTASDESDPPPATGAKAEALSTEDTPGSDPRGEDKPKGSFVFPSIGAQTGFVGKKAKPKPRVQIRPEPIRYGETASEDDSISLSFSSRLNISAIETDRQAPAADEVPVMATTAAEPAEEIILEELSPAQDYKVEYGATETCPETETDGLPEAGAAEAAPAEPATADAVEEDFRSEDEQLDEVFRGAAILDPMQHHTDDTSADPLHSTETEIAARLSQKPFRPKRKNFLQRRYRITHFWPRSWKAKWQARKPVEPFDAAPEDPDFVSQQNTEETGRA